MNAYENILEFKGTWRNYQDRVLKASDSYLSDKKIHIVAAPGAGKTTLGIELIRRVGLPCLILSPRIVIRQQWLERIEHEFLNDGLCAETYLSNNIRKPKLLTSITYQTLFCGMTQYQGTEEEEDSDYKEDVNFADFELVKAVKEAGIGVICLDECHHLKNEWWKALETFMKEMNDVVVISLTATPPYDSTPAQWERYCDMCGPVDEEISVPELVREGSLCPHQDYVYFNYPSREEQEMIDSFRNKAAGMFEQLLSDTELAKAVGTHPALSGYDGTVDAMLENPEYLSAILIYSQAKSIPFSLKWLKVLGVKKLPNLSEKWLEILLQGFLYDDINNYSCDNEYREGLIKSLKAAGLVERKKVGFLVNGKVEKALINSTGKLESIRQIAHAEYDNMGKELRMLILTDYIRKEYKSTLGNPEKKLDTIGVLPIFELLRRENRDWKPGILCGSLIIIPDSAIPALKQAAIQQGCSDAIKTTQLYDITGQPLGYSEVKIQGKIHAYAQMITQLFGMGEIEILIGTKSLLGEGWDSPCINSLILASFVGSYVLSNQMRGRAIRIMNGNPTKTSNIWHLVCLSHKGEQKEKKLLGIQNPELSEDYYTLKRRMDGFFGISYDGSSIENGIERLSIIHEPYNERHIAEINAQMIEKSRNREALFSQWKEAVFLYDKMETVEDCKMDGGFLKSGAYFINAIGLIVILVALQFANTYIRAAARTNGQENNWQFFIVSLLIVLGLTFCIQKLVRALSPLKRLKLMGRGIVDALRQKGQLISDCRVELEEEDGCFYHAYLTGGTVREKNLFAECLEEMLASVDNQRYLLHSKKGRLTMANYYCVPAMFARTKEDAALFQECLKPYIGVYNLIYTRNTEGRKLLLKARAKAFGSRNERIFDRKKKVKGKLE